MLDAPPRIGLPIDPRIQARLLEVRRDGSRRKRRLTAVGASMTVLALLAWGAGRSPLLAVQHVEVRGAGRTPGVSVLAAAGLDRRHQMLDLNPARMTVQLEALPWVDQARVRRHWPTTVEVVLTSRAPVAQLPGPDGQPVVIDARGRVLAAGAVAAELIARPSPRLTHLLGVGTGGPPGSLLAPVARAALALVTAVPPALPAAPPPAGPTTVDAVAATADGIWSVVLSSGISVIFGSPDQLEPKLVAMRTVLERVGPAGVATIDVRVPDTPVLTRGTRGTSVSTIPRG